MLFSLSLSLSLFLPLSLSLSPYFSLSLSLSISLLCVVCVLIFFSLAHTHTSLSLPLSLYLSLPLSQLSFSLSSLSLTPLSLSFPHSLPSRLYRFTKYKYQTYRAKEGEEILPDLPTFIYHHQLVDPVIVPQRLMVALTASLGFVFVIMLCLIALYFW